MSDMELHHYRVTMKPDAGTVPLDTMAYDFQSAAEMICRCEGAPLRSVITVRRMGE